MVSIIITYHEEGLPFLMECITQVRASIDVPIYEIIVVDDLSKVPLEPIEDITIIRNTTNLGVGGSFDVGVAAVKYENIILMACDMRFIENRWVSKLVEEIENNPKSITCTCCVGLNETEQDFAIRRTKARYYGATILMYHDHKSNPKKEKNFRGIIEAKWWRQDKEAGDNSYEVPCILGACYGVKKQWYEYIDGFWGHIKWGTLEPYISLKSWLFGGSCRVAPAIETAHIFKKNGTHGITQEHCMYNKYLVSTLLLDDYNKLNKFLGNNNVLAAARKVYDTNKSDILAKREEYMKKKVLSELDFAKRFDIDMRCE
jgi:glycosyltransferase involved in cell wall biosynthesis